MPEWDNDNRSGGGLGGRGDNDWNRPGSPSPSPRPGGFPGRDNNDWNRGRNDNDWNRGGHGNDWDRNRPGYHRPPIIRRPPVVYRSRPYKRPSIFNFPRYTPRRFNHRPKTNPAWWYPYWNQWVAPIINPIYSWFQPYPQPQFPTYPTIPQYPGYPPGYPQQPQYPGYNPYPQTMPSVIYP